MYRSAFPIFRGSGRIFILSRPSAKSNPPVSSLYLTFRLPFFRQQLIILSQVQHHHTVRASLPWSRRSLTASTLLSPLLLSFFLSFLPLLSSFCQLDTAALFGSRLIHSFGCCPSLNAPTTFSPRQLTLSLPF